MAAYYFGNPQSGNGTGTSVHPWNQAGFNATKLSFGDTLTVQTDALLTSTINQPLWMWAGSSDSSLSAGQNPMLTALGLAT